VNALMDDYYRLDDRAYTLVGERTGRRFRLGDPIKVKVSRVNRLERKIDFVVVDDQDRRGQG
jgi:ribonuclease R